MPYHQDGNYGYGYPPPTNGYRQQYQRGPSYSQYDGQQYYTQSGMQPQPYPQASPMCSGGYQQPYGYHQMSERSDQPTGKGEEGTSPASAGSPGSPDKRYVVIHY
jgi:hypothetical protein